MISYRKGKEDTLIELIEVSKFYSEQEKPAVDNLSMKIFEGEITVFIGPSGCGKSTTLKMINRLIEPSNGIIKINGEDITRLDPNKLRMKIGYVIQQIGLLPHKTIGENVAIVPKLYGWEKNKIKERVEDLLVTMGLNPKEVRNKYPSQLSGGQMQRVGVARAMAVDPPIMLMDEPFGAVDPIARSHLQDEFLRLQKDMKRTICFVTHDIDEAIKMGDRIAIFNEGKVVQYDTPINILMNPVNEFVRNFLGPDRLVKNLKLMTIEDAMKDIDYVNKDSSLICHLLEEKTYVKKTEALQGVLNIMLEKGADNVVVLNDDKDVLGVISFKNIREFMHKKVGE